MFATGCFDQCISSAKNVPLVFDHNINLVGGQVLEFKLDGKTLWMKAFIDQATPVGRDMITLMRYNILDSLSIGAIYNDKENSREGVASSVLYVRNVKQIDEVSLVAIPADYHCLLDTTTRDQKEAKEDQLKRMEKIFQIERRIEVKEIYEHLIEVYRLAYREKLNAIIF